MERQQSQQQGAHPPPAVDKIYWIKCSDGLCVSMSQANVESLCDHMPTLRFLLLGHPRMQPKELPTLSDGTTQVLDIPADLQVSRSSFVLLINCLYGVEPLPPRESNRRSSRLKELAETLVVLGGCQALEERLRHHHTGSVINPMTPEEDIEDKYDWHMTEDAAYTDRMFGKALIKEGYTLASVEARDDYSRPRFYLRKPKGSRSG